jgi:phage gp36-like protein
MYITLDEIKTHLYDEQIEAISGTDDTILTAAIDGATQEAKGYLHKFNIPAIFGEVGDARNALLVIFVKDIAIWHYINLANPGTDYKSRQDRYNRAVSWLKSVQAGEVVPDLPIAVQPDNTAGSVSWNSNYKRENYI